MVDAYVRPLKDRIVIGAKVRLKEGAVVKSRHPKHPEKVVTRPYWVVIDRVTQDGKIFWIGSANYWSEATIADVDDVEP